MNKEARQSFKRLNKENKKIIERIEVYLGTQYLNEVCYEELLADIIGMALESQERGEDFSDTVGMNIGVFCQELAANTPKQSFAERILGLFSWAMFCVCILIPILWAYVMLFPAYSPSEADIFSFTIPVSHLIKYVAIVFVFALGSHYIRMGTRIVHLGAMAVYSVIFISLMIVSDIFFPIWIDRARQIHLNVFVWVGIFGVLSLLFLLGKKLVMLGIAYNKNKNKHK